MRFRYYIDFGSGYQLIDLLDNALIFNVEKSEISKLIQLKSLSGSFAIQGDDAKDVYDLRTSSYYVPFKIESYNNSTWSTLHECNIDIRGVYDNQKKKLTINTFIENETLEKKLLADFETKFNILGEITPTQLEASVTSTNFEIDSLPTNLSESAYKAARDIYGNTVNEPDPRWDYFLLVNTGGTPPDAIVYTWQTMILTFDPNIGSYDYGYVGYTLGTVNEYPRWFKLPTVQDETETFTIKVSYYNYRFDRILDYLVSSLDSGIEFDNANRGTSVYDMSKLYFGLSTELNKKEFDKFEITLAEILNFLRDYFDYHWYIDDSTSPARLKFNTTPFIYYSGSALNWTNEISRPNLTPAYEPMPDKQIWKFLDETQDARILSYFNKGVRTQDNIFDYSVDIYHDFYNVKRGLSDDSKLIFYFVPSTYATVQDAEYFQDLYANKGIYADYNIYVASNDPSASYTNYPKTVFETRPIWKITHRKTITDWAAFDVFKGITLDLGFGYLDSYEIDLKSNIGTFNIFLKTVTL